MMLSKTPRKQVNVFSHIFFLLSEASETSFSIKRNDLKRLAGYLDLVMLFFALMQY